MKVFGIKCLFVILTVAGVRNASAQIIGDIGHEAFDNKIIVSYTVNGLTDHQQLSVNLYCSDDGFNKSVASVTGNGVGPAITGNGQKTIVWDVLKDRPFLEGNIAFEIKALVIAREQQFATRSPAMQGTAMTPEERKSALYSEISSAVGNFIIEVKDLVSAFRLVDESIYEDNMRLRQLTDAIINYNTSFNKLNNERMNYEKQVLMLWNNEALHKDVSYLFDYALGELHAVNVLELNASLTLINDINQGKIAGRKSEKDARLKVQTDIIQNTSQLDKRIQELERRATRILYTLSNR